MNRIDPNIQQKVTELLGWNDQEYAEFIYACGLAYLDDYIPAYPQVVKQICRSENFWTWWRSHWQNRDKEFIESIELSDPGVFKRREVYEFIHDPELLAHGIYLNGQVLEQSYATLISEITKEQCYAQDRC